MGGKEKKPYDVPHSADKLKFCFNKGLVDLPFTPAAFAVVMAAGLCHCVAFLKMAAEAASGKAVEITATMQGEVLTVKPWIEIMSAVYDECRAALKGGKVEVRRVITGVQLTAGETRMLVDKFFSELNDVREDGPRVTCYTCSAPFQPHSRNEVKWGKDGPVIMERNGKPVRLGDFRAVVNGGNLWTKAAVCPTCQKMAKEGGADNPQTYSSAQADQFLARQKKEREEWERQQQEKRLKAQRVAAIFNRKPGDPPVGTHGGDPRNGGASGKSCQKAAS